ncbi:hypothetical protein [Sodalis glossinidius]|uniref:hypothetical protein n=1 Tax=Sodalis glossinidius TaxID=63612 RepID=UPI000321DA29|nr:hypothetical protein [Sodalis glossinidius]
MKIEGDEGPSRFWIAPWRILSPARAIAFSMAKGGIFTISAATRRTKPSLTRATALFVAWTQQGYSGFSTWTRGLSWAICSFAELLEYLQALPADKWHASQDRASTVATLEKAAAAVCDFYLAFTTLDGIPYWDTGAPGLATLDAPYERYPDPANAVEPVDSSAAAIAAQGLLRFGAWLGANQRAGAQRYRQAGLTVLQTLLDDRYLSLAPQH